MSQIVGRTSELAAIGRFLAAVPDGPRTILIEGEAGIGKTTLWTQVIEAARESGFHVLRSRSAITETKHSYGALTDTLTKVSDEAFTALPPPQRHAIDVTLLREEPRADVPDPRTVAMAFLGILRYLADSGPTLLALDDAQWMDTPSARVLEFAARRLEDLRIGIAIAARTQEESSLRIGIDRPFDAAHIERVDVGPLSVDAIHEVVRRALGKSLPKPVLVKISDASGGNPFYALEIARALGDDRSGATPGRSLTLPSTLRGLVHDRLAGLRPSADALLLTISATPCPREQVLERVVGRGYQTALRVAIDRGLIERNEDRLSFTHPLLSAVVYERADDERRRRVHNRLAEVVDDPEERARHLALAASRPDARLTTVLDAGARSARDRGAPDAAAELADAALRLSPPQRAAEIGRRRIDAADHHFAAGDGVRARQLLEDAVAGSRGRLRAEAMLRLGVVRHHLDDQQAAVDLLERALDDVGDDRALRSEIEQQLSWAVSLLGNIPRGGEHARAALALAEERGDGPAISRALAMVAVHDFLLGLGVRDGLIRRSLELEDWTGSLPVQWRPSFIHGYVLKVTGDLDGARTVLEELRERLSERGDEAALPWVLFHLSELEMFAGRLDTAAAHAADGHLITSQTGQGLMGAFLLSVQAHVEAYRGSVDGARALAQEGLALAQQGGLVPAIQFNISALAFVDLSVGDVAAVHERLGPLAEMLTSVGLGEPGTLRFLPDEVEVLIALRETDKAASLLEPFEQRARELVRPWAMGAASRCRALLASVAGEPSAAVDHAEEALLIHGTLDQPFERGRTLLSAGQVFRRAKRKRAAKDALEEAVAIFDGLGATLWTAKARAELGRTGLRPAAPTTLTGTEERVAELAASGLTNREIADATFISPKSVEGVLGRIYRKLGIRSRAELGARMSTRGRSQA